MPLTQDMLLRIKEEIVNDSEKRGYAGKTDAEVAWLLNESYSIPHIEKKMILSRLIDTLSPEQITTMIQSGVSISSLLEMKTKEELTTTLIDYSSRIYSIFLGISSAPNVVTEEDVIDAKNV